MARFHALSCPTLRLAFVATLIGASFGVSAPVMAEASRCEVLAIGVSHYRAISPLASPVHDAAAFADAINAFGCRVTVVRNPNTEQFGAAVSAFVDRARGADRAIFYYSGHGFQANGEAYFLPSDASFDRDPSLFRRDYLSVGSVLQKLDEAGVGFRWIVSDACRNFPAFLMGPAQTTFGLAEERLPGSHAVVSYASAQGEYSRDTSRRFGLSLYTAALVDTLQRAERFEIRDLLQTARVLTVKTMREAASRSLQQPWTAESLMRQEVFVRASGQTP
jgi:uncharacterized caspase-like protein